MSKLHPDAGVRRAEAASQASWRTFDAHRRGCGICDKAYGLEAKSGIRIVMRCTVGENLLLDLWLTYGRVKEARRRYSAERRRARKIQEKAVG